VVCSPLPGPGGVYLQGLLVYKNNELIFERTLEVRPQETRALYVSACQDYIGPL
jgi:hypothetical protein